LRRGPGAAEPASDDFFAAVGAGRETLPTVLKPSSSSGPRSPLAAAYAAPVAGAASLPEAANAPQWKVLEPPDGADPVPHQECHLNRRDDAWSLLAASVRGRLHAHQARWRDDAFAQTLADDWSCLAVADGAGSAPLSRVGARVACARGVAALAAALTGWRPRVDDSGAPPQDDLQRLQAALAGAARAARDGVAAEAERRGALVRDLHTTLLLLAHTPFGDADLLGAFQVGDGAIGLYSDPGRCLPLGIADHGAFAGETLFLTTPGLEDFERRTAFALPRGLRAVALMIDGVADDFFPAAQRLVHLFDGDPIPGLETPGGGPLRGVLLAAVGDPRGGQALAEWLQYEKRGSSDDRTLALLYRHHDRPGGPPPTGDGP